jgi:hypothetical protein
VTKPLSEFNKHKNRHDGLQTYCRECCNEESREWKLKNPDHHLLYSYNITLAQRDQMIADQGGGCAICKKPLTVSRDIHVDHDHDTDAIRGILCHRCNTALGLMLENTDTMRNAISYLEYHATEKSTTPIPAGHNSQSEEHTKHGAVSATGLGEDDDYSHHHCGADARQDVDHSAQASSGDSVGYGGEEVGTSFTITSIQIDGKSKPKISRIKLGGGHLSDKP